MQSRQDKLFYELISHVVETEDFVKMRQYRHHVHGCTYDHSIKVAYLCYRHYQRFGSKVNLEELIRGALLHDYFLYDHHDKDNDECVSGLIHWFVHPKYALNNARRDYPDLTKNEQDMIGRHMFPLTLIPPKTRYGWLVCFYDKVAAVKEWLQKKGAAG